MKKNNICLRYKIAKLWTAVHYKGGRQEKQMLINASRPCNLTTIRWITNAILHDKKEHKQQASTCKNVELLVTIQRKSPLWSKDKYFCKRNTEWELSVDYDTKRREPTATFSRTETKT